MIVETITRLETFNALEASWNEVHARDEVATVFTTHAWLAGWLKATVYPWFVLAVRPAKAGAPVAFLTLSVKEARRRFGVAQIFQLAGHPISNHTGLVCAPGQETAALAALAEHLRGLRWRSLNFQYVSDPRLKRLVQVLGEGRTVETEPASSPYAPLPDSLEQFLNSALSGKAQREVRRRERKSQGVGMRITTADTGFEHHLNAFLELHLKRFGTAEPRHLDLYRSLFSACQRAGTLHLHVLWHRDTPVAAQVGFLDPKHSTYHGCQGGWDPTYRELAPGLLIKLDAVRYAIHQGFDRFDFGRGAHEYKFDLGAQPAYTQHLRLSRGGWAWSARRRRARLASIGHHD